MKNTNVNTKPKGNKKDKKKKSNQKHLTQNVDLRAWIQKNGMPKEVKKKK